MSGLPLISRRRLLTAMALSPLLWQMNTAHAAAIDPNRIVALEWLPVEYYWRSASCLMAWQTPSTIDCGSANHHYLNR